MRLNFWTMLVSAALLITSADVASGAINAWTPIGPDGGFVLALAVDPETPTTLYAGTQNGGVFKTTNAGDSWRGSRGFPDSAVNALAVDPSTPTTVYAGTDDGVFKSVDGGT